MPKAIYCARCGIQLAMTRKVVKMQILDVVEPHQCGEVQEIPLVDTSDLEKALKPKESTGTAPVETARVKSAKSLLETFPFVKKLNEAQKEIERPHLQDIRPVRDEVVSSIEPSNIRDQVLRQTGLSQPKQTHLAFEDEGDDTND